LFINSQEIIAKEIEQINYKELPSLINLASVSHVPPFC